MLIASVMEKSLHQMKLESKLVDLAKYKSSKNKQASWKKEEDQQGQMCT